MSPKCAKYESDACVNGSELGGMPGDTSDKDGCGFWRAKGTPKGKSQRTHLQRMSESSL